MGRILIADPSGEFSESMVNTLCDQHTLRLCHDAPTAIQHLRDFRPDVMVLELQLRGMDGLKLLESLDRHHRPAIIVYTSLRTDYIEHKLQSLCDYVMYKPGDLNMLTAQIEDFIADAEAARQTPADSAQALLQQLIHRPWRHGYKYLSLAVTLYAQNPMQAVTKELYPTVAREFGTTASCVEKAMRTAIHQAWAERDNALWRKYMFTDRNGQVIKPSNTAFLTAIVRYVYAHRQKAL